LLKVYLRGIYFLVTAASFIVFNGAMKTTSDIKAKVSVVEGTVKNHSILPRYFMKACFH
jgi:hypothetical protein